MTSPGVPRMCLYVTRFRVRSWEYRPHAEPRYSPVGSKPPVKPKASMAVRYVPPFFTAVLSPPPLVPLSLLQAAPTMATMLASATTLSNFFRPFTLPPLVDSRCAVHCVRAWIRPRSPSLPTRARSLSHHVGLADRARLEDRLPTS